MLFNETMSIGERFINSVAITVLGMVVVFVVLIVIAYSLDLLRIMFGDKKKVVNDDDEEKIIKEREDISMIQNNSDIKTDTDLIAVLTAAVAAQSSVDDTTLVLLTAAILAQDSRSSEQIIVRSILPVKQKRSIWALAGRQGMM